MIILTTLFAGYVVLSLMIYTSIIVRTIKKLLAEKDYQTAIIGTISLIGVTYLIGVLVILSGLGCF